MMYAIEGEQGVGKTTYFFAQLNRKQAAGVKAFVLTGADFGEEIGAEVAKDINVRFWYAQHVFCGIPSSQEALRDGYEDRLKRIAAKQDVLYTVSERMGIPLVVEGVESLKVNHNLGLWDIRGAALFVSDRYWKKEQVPTLLLALFELVLTHEVTVYLDVAMPLTSELRKLGVIHSLWLEPNETKRLVYVHSGTYKPQTFVLHNK